MTMTRKTCDPPERWVAVPRPGDSVVLLPAGPDAVGPDIFIRLADLPHDRAEPWHTLILKGDKRWRLVHPLHCDLNDCPFDAVAEQWAEPPAPDGRYRWEQPDDDPARLGAA